MKFRRVFSIILCTALLISSLGIFSASAATWNGYGYEKNSDTDGGACVTITSSNHSEDSIVIPATINGMRVTEIKQLGNDATLPPPRYTLTISIPAYVRRISPEAFYIYGNLRSFTVDPNNKYFTAQDGVLYNKAKTKLICCPLSKIGTVTIPGSVTSIDDKAFGGIGSNNKYYRCLWIEGFSISGTSSSYATQDGVLLNKAKTTLIRFPCSRPHAESYSIPATVQNIGDYAFFYADNFKKVVVPAAVKTIGKYAFYKSSVREITFGKGVTDIGKCAFAWCESLQGVSLPSGVRSIGESAFAYCHSLKKLSLAAGVSGAAAGCFMECSSLKEVTIPGSIKNIPMQMFQACFELEKVTLRKGIKTIGGDAFYSCSKLNKVTLSEDLTTIGAEAFMSCTELKSLTIPASVTKIGWLAFYGSGLRNVTYYGTRAQWKKFGVNITPYIPCNIQTHASRSGSVTGGGVFDAGTTVILEAVSKKDFLGWYDLKGKMITKDNPHSFVCETSGIFIAMFEGDVFYDIPKKAWYLQSAMEAHEQGLVSGTNPITFSAEKTLTRAEMVTLLARMEGVKANGTATTVFKDVPQKSWYTGAVAWAYKNNIVAGVSKTEFAPAAVATREQFITILMRYLTGYKKMKIGRASLPYSDAKSVSPFARASMERAQCIGLVQGTDGKVRPQATITRAESVSLIMRVKNYIESQTSNE